MLQSERLSRDEPNWSGRLSFEMSKLRKKRNAFPGGHCFPAIGSVGAPKLFDLFEDMICLSKNHSLNLRLPQTNHEHRPQYATFLSRTSRVNPIWVLQILHESLWIPKKKWKQMRIPTLSRCASGLIRGSARFEIGILVLIWETMKQ